jgi:SPP1 family predicted phage head-tail adaptor
MAMRTIPAGAKDFTIILQKRSEERTESGGVKETWSDHVKVMASRKDSQDGEAYDGVQKVSSSQTSWRIWWRNDVNAADWRVKDIYGNQVYDIKSIVMIGRRQELELYTEIKDNE